MNQPAPDGIRARVQPMTINTAGLILAFGWACYTLLTVAINRYLPGVGVAPAALAGMYLTAVGGFLTYMAVGSLRYGQHRTQSLVIARGSSPIGFWILTSTMGVAGVGLLGAGMFALVRLVVSRG